MAAGGPAPVPTSIDKALEVCEALSGNPRGMSLSDLARTLRQPPSSVHRLLGVLKRRGPPLAQPLRIELAFDVPPGTPVERLDAMAEEYAELGLTIAAGLSATGAGEASTGFSSTVSPASAAR